MSLAPLVTPAARAAAVLVSLALLFACQREPAQASSKGKDLSMNIYDQEPKTLDGTPGSLSQFRGKVTLLVNVASFCGNTPQYTELERLHQKYGPQGFSVLGFPSNDFGKQEPGSAQEIRDFCSTKYKVTFPMFEKVQTKPGPEQSPVYAALEKASGKLPNWNFGKYVIGRDGRVVEYFNPKVQPDAPEVIAAIEKALSAPQTKL